MLQAAEAEEQRKALASLRGHGKQMKVGSIRVGAAVEADGPGVNDIKPFLSLNLANKLFFSWRVYKG